MMTQLQKPRVLVADPPWKFGDSLPGKGRGAVKHYDCLNIHQIKNFELPEMADDSVLFLWRVASMQNEALEVMKAWGYTLKTELVWIKETKHGKLHFGMGHTVRASHEVCLIGTRGSRRKPHCSSCAINYDDRCNYEYQKHNPAKIKVKTRSVRSVFQAKVGEHSAKPDEFYRIVEELYDGPYAELFARRHQNENWTCYGDQVNGKQETN